MSDKTGDWTVALAPKTLYSPLTIINPMARQAAATMSYRQGNDRVEGFVISSPSKASDVAHEVASAIKLISAHFHKVFVESEGRKGKTHDGDPVVRDLTLTVQNNGCDSGIRNGAMLALLMVPMARTRGLPSSTSGTSFHRTVRITTVLRGDGRVHFIGAVSNQYTDLDLSKKTGSMARDLGGGSALARHGSTLDWRCETHTRDRPGSNQVDFIWTVDESSSMYGIRQKVADMGKSFLRQALASGLDFRVGVTGMNKPGGKYKSTVGRFCSRASTDMKDNGGYDRFLGATQASNFVGCMRNPPGREVNNPHGLQNAVEAVKTHLPRATQKNDKIRTEARVVLIAVTARAPASLWKTISDQHQASCALPAKNQADLNKKIAPLITELSGTSKPGARVEAFHALAGLCKNTCKHHVAHGYIEVAKALGGQVYSLCDKSLAPHVGKIIAKAAAGAGILRLNHEPVGASLTVAHNGKTLVRSPVDGFDHVPVKQGLTFSGVKAWPKASTVTVSYARWR